MKENEITESDINIQKFDIYEHLRDNLDKEDFRCECKEKPKFYCIACKTSVCENCNMEEHKLHTLIPKAHSNLNEEDLNYLLGGVEKSITENQTFKLLDKLKKSMIVAELENEKKLKDLIEKKKKSNFEKIEKIFKTLEIGVKLTQDKIKEIKNLLINFKEKYKKFFKDENEKNNFIFLLNYDIINLIKYKTYDIFAYQKQIDLDINYFNIINNQIYDFQQKELEKILNEKSKNVTETYVDKNSEEIKSTFKNSILKSEIIYNSLNNKHKIEIKNYTPDSHLFKLIECFNGEHFFEIKKRLDVYSSEIEKFKVKIFEFSSQTKKAKKLDKHHPFKEMLKEINIYENNKSTDPNALFSLRAPANNSIEKNRLSSTDYPSECYFTPISTDGNNIREKSPMSKNKSKEEYYNLYTTKINKKRRKKSSVGCSPQKFEIEDTKKPNKKNEIKVYGQNLNTKKRGKLNSCEKKSNVNLERTNIYKNSSVKKQDKFNTIGNTDISLFFASKDDVNLELTLLKNLFYEIFLEVYDKYFRRMKSDLLRSQSDLNIKENSSINCCGSCLSSCKINDGTNNMTIYDKKNNRVLKIKFNLPKNPYGYNGVFPIGCRSCLVGDKIYISGGKNEQQQFKVVLVYDFVKDKLKRMIDMNFARSYHTIIYIDCFNTIMVMGGENNPTNEVFDPLTNRWLILPKLNNPRANCIFHFDKPNGIIYSMFGQEKKIIDSKYSNYIEYLDITQMDKGFQKFNYFNFISSNLNCRFNTYPLSNILILCYCGYSINHSEKSIFVIQLDKQSITYIDAEIAQKLRLEAIRNQTLSSILSKYDLFN